ncbi:Sensory neuron membrane protein 2 [Frankliniella fusca]|uniref:Sensory neuron membrane protein 2 n=1 Tax=Frankliniella fusca TaxID=407009 RepID=A0AAE1HH06_9NEOP|nr:Sensory neuron membrane protein 2 [Frankliniella fusca]
MRITMRGWLWIAACGAALVVMGALLGWLLFPYVVDLVIGKQLALKQGTDAWDRFVDLPIALDMKLSIFNVTNKEEIMQGMKPRVQEVGPFVYKQYRHKYDIKYNEKDDTVSYRQKLIHIFDEEQSAPFKATDMVTVVNPALLSMLGIMQNIPVLSKGTMFVDAAAPLLFPGGLFVTSTADDLLFRGVRIKCGSLESESAAASAAGLASAVRTNAGIPIKPRLAALITCSSFKRIKVPTVSVAKNGDVLFSLFGYVSYALAAALKARLQKNNTDDGVYTVQTGITNPEMLAQITAWEGKKEVTAWGGPICNAINGTQGDIFSPYITKDTIISVFSTDICRSMSLTYVQDTTFRGVDGYRFAPNWEVMASPEQNGNNYCFCPQVASGLTKNNGCLRRGAMDLSGCQGIPVIVSYPHFFQADELYQNGVEGLHPNAELHRMQVDIEPMTGTPLLGGKKMQLNFQMKQVDGVKLTAGVRDTLFPVAWMYEGAMLNTELLDLLNDLLFSKLKILNIVKYTMLALGAVLCTTGGVVFSVMKIRMRSASVQPEPQPPHHRPSLGSGRGRGLGGGAGDVVLRAPLPPLVATADATAETKLQAGVNSNGSTGSNGV